MKTRESYQLIILEPAKSRLSKNICPICEKPKAEWKRCTNFRCCSPKCTQEFQKYYYVYGWNDLRLKAFKRDNFTCVKCKKQPKKIFEEYILDENNHFIEIEGEPYQYKTQKVEKIDDSKLIGDHIIPIALGGEQWDINNIQTLCIECNKIKTKEDIGKIAKLRSIENKLIKGQRQL